MMMYVMYMQMKNVSDWIPVVHVVELNCRTNASDSESGVYSSCSPVYSALWHGNKSELTWLITLKSEKCEMLNTVSDTCKHGLYILCISGMVKVFGGHTVLSTKVAQF